MKKANRRSGAAVAKSRTLTPVSNAPEAADPAALLADLRALIQSARQRIATVANSTYTRLCWQVGRRLLRESLQAGRGAYGKQIVATVSQQLTAEFGAGFSYTALTRMARFAEWITDDQILASLSQELSWSHFIELLPVRDPLARDFYAEMCRIERWDVRTLRRKIGGMLFQRTALSRKPKAVIASELAQLRDGHVTPDVVFRDPYLLDLLGLTGAYSERDLESAILREIEGVLLELGTGFTFVARQKRMSIGRDDFHLDLLFFHRRLRRLIAVELKLESFQPAHVGQMELYLRWLDKHERAPGEEAPIGLILCASADAEQVELLELDAKSIRVSEYLTELPPLRLLRARLHHSSQGGKTSAAMSEALSGTMTEEEDAGVDPEDTVNAALEKRMAARKMLTNASYFAFTATPKNKTLEMFGDACVAVYVSRLGEDGQVDFKGKAKVFCRTYGFLSSVIPYSNAQWEKLSILLNLLTPKLPAPKEEDLSKGILEAIDMDSYRVEKKAVLKIALADTDAEIEPVPTDAGGRKNEPELDRLSNILKTFNEQFGTLFTDTDRVAKRIRDDIAPKVAADAAYQNAKENTPHTARMAHDQALGKVMQHLLKDDTQVYKQFVENESFRRFVGDMVYAITNQDEAGA